MVAPSVLPGRAFKATTPNSNLFLHWRAQDRSLTTVDRNSTGTLTRASAGGLTDGRGHRTANALTDVRLVGPAADNQPRWGVSTAGVPHLLLEDTRTNLQPISNPTTGWQVSSAFSTGGETTVAPDGTLVTLLTDNSTTVLELMQQDVETTSTVALVTWYTKWNGSTFGSIHRFRFIADGIGARGGVTWNFGSTGTMTIATTEAGNLLAGPKHVGNNWWKTTFEATAILSSNDNDLRIEPALTAVGTTGGDMFIAHVDVQDVASTGLFATSHIPTVSAAVSRAKETLSFPFLPVPQAMTIYFKFIESGTISAVDFSRVWNITNAASADPEVGVDNGNTNKYRFRHDNNVDAEVVVTAAAAPSIGDTVELRGVLAVNGSVQLGQSINGAGEVVTAVSSIPANGLATAWASTTRLYVNASGAAGSVGFNKFQEIKIAAGTLTLTQCREAF